MASSDWKFSSFPRDLPTGTHVHHLWMASVIDNSEFLQRFQGQQLAFTLDFKAADFNGSPLPGTLALATGQSPNLSSHPGLRDFQDAVLNAIKFDWDQHYIELTASVMSPAAAAAAADLHFAPEIAGLTGVWRTGVNPGEELLPATLQLTENGYSIDVIDPVTGLVSTIAHSFNPVTQQFSDLTRTTYLADIDAYLNAEWGSFSEAGLPIGGAIDAAANDNAGAFQMRVASAGGV